MTGRGKGRRRAAAFLAASVALAAAGSAAADDGALFEDSGSDVQSTDGISIEGQEEESLFDTLGIPLPESADVQEISQILTDLGQYDSTTGSDDEMNAAGYIESKMKEYGYTVQEQAFHEGFIDASGKDEPGINILAERGANSASGQTQDIFIIASHYDVKRDAAEGRFICSRQDRCRGAARGGPRAVGA